MLRRRHYGEDTLQGHANSHAALEETIKGLLALSAPVSACSYESCLNKPQIHLWQDKSISLIVFSLPFSSCVCRCFFQLPNHSFAYTTAI